MVYAPFLVYVMQKSCTIGGCLLSVIIPLNTRWPGNYRPDKAGQILTLLQKQQLILAILQCNLRIEQQKKLKRFFMAMIITFCF